MAFLRQQAASELEHVGRTDASHMSPLRQLLLLVIATGWSSHAVLAGSPVRIQGSTAFNSLPPQHHQETIGRRAGLKPEVVASKSIWGLVALLDGHADVAMISAGLDEQQTFLAKEQPNVPAARRLIDAARWVAVEHLM